MSSSTPSICVVVVFSRTNHRSGSGSGALRSPSHKRFTGIMLPPFPYLPLLFFASLPALLSPSCLILSPHIRNLDTKPGSVFPWLATYFVSRFCAIFPLPGNPNSRMSENQLAPSGVFSDLPSLPLLLLPSYPLAWSATHLSLALASPSNVQAPKLSLTLSYARP